jgi:PTH1 family peptidyl-tRNA hydrolase
MKLIVGLGNPGPQYERTRHNAGFLAVDRLARRHMPGAIPKGRFNAALTDGAIAGERCILFKPTTYMNGSGAAVLQAVGFYKLDPAADLLVIVDDVALPTGFLRLRPAGSAGGHNGLADIERALGTETYARCRIGIDAAPPFMDQADYVLGRFTSEQWSAMDPALDRAADAAETFITSGITTAMNRFNSRNPPPAESDPQISK